MSKTVIITGGSGGIGSACALALSREGYHIALGYHKNKESAERISSEISALGGVCHPIQADLSTFAGGQTLARESIRLLGEIHSLVCCAGSAHFGLLTHLSDEDWHSILGDNLHSAFYAIRGVLPSMVARQQGSIVTVSSVWGQTGASCEVAYSAAKAGVIGLTKGLAKEVGPSHIRVNCVAAGVIDTEMNGSLSAETLSELAEETPLGRIGTPHEVASVVAFLVSEQSSFMTGQILSPNGGFYV
ncbi:MAG: SDR family oxidoreductase [Eubacteriales bacterium]